MAITPNTTFTSGAILTAPQMNRLPWGIVGYDQRTSNQAGIGAVTDILDTGGGSLSVVWTAISSRYYRTTLYVPYAEQQVAPAFPSILITDGSNVIKQKSEMYQVNLQGAFLSAVVVETGLSGSVTRKGRALTSGNTVSLGGNPTFPIFIVVEDIGQA
jgi:hypothetical protein